MRHRLIAGTINHYKAEPGWTNWHVDKSARGIWAEGRGVVQPEYVADIAHMPIVPSGFFDEVKCWQVLEHLERDQAEKAVAEFYRVLKPGGVADIQVPDFDALCKAWLERQATPEGLLQCFYGQRLENHADYELQWHRYGYNEDTLRELLEPIGFVVLEVIREDLRIRAAKGE